MKFKSNKLKFLFLSMFLASFNVFGEELETSTKILVQEKAEDENLVLQFKNIKLERNSFSTQSASGKAGQIIGKLPSVILGGAPGEDKDLMIRGMDKEYVRFELDGIKLPGSGEKREYQMGPLSERMIGEVEILRNPTPEYEADGIAGRVIAKTRTSQENIYELNLEGGYRESAQYEFENVGVFINKNITDNLSITANYNHNANPFLKEKTSENITSTSTKKTTKLTNEKENKNLTQDNFIGDVNYKYKNGDIKLSLINLEVEENKTKESNVTQTVVETGKADKITTSLTKETELKTTKTEGLSLKINHSINDLFKIENKVSYAETSEIKDAIKSGTTETEDKADKLVEVETKLVLLHELLTPSEFKFGAGVTLRDRYKDKYKNGILSTGKDSYSLSENIIYSFVQNEFLINEKLSVLGGVRIENSSLDSSSTGINAENKDNTFVAPGLHVIYKLSDNINLKTSVSKSINRPKFDTLAPHHTVSGTSITTGNPNLDSEESINLDANIEYKSKKSWLSASAFYKDIKNVLEENVSTGEKYTYLGTEYDLITTINAGNGWTKGIEFEEKFKMGNNFELWSNQSFIKTELTQKDGNKRPFKNQPELVASLGMDYSAFENNTKFSVYGKYIGEINNKTLTSTKTTIEIEESKTSVSAKVTQKLFKNTELYFEGENILAPKKEKTKTETTSTQTVKETSYESTESVYTLGINVRF